MNRILYKSTNKFKNLGLINKNRHSNVYKNEKKTIIIRVLG